MQPKTNGASPFRMRVLHVIPAVAARYGGPSEAVVRTCRALEAAGVQVSIVATDADGQGRLPVACGEWTRYQGVSARFFPRQWSEAFKYSWPLAGWLRKHVCEYDLVHIHAVFSHSSMAAAAAARRARVPYMVRPLGSLNPWALNQKPASKRILWVVGIGNMLRRASAIHCTSQSEKVHAERAIGRKTGVVVPLGAELTALNPGEIPDFRASGEIVHQPYILAMGRLHPVKGLDVLITAFLDLVRQTKFSNWLLIIAGDGEPKYVESLKRLAANHPRGAAVVFTGWLAGEEKVAALRNASLFAMPSHQENFGIAAFEAMAHGVPVVVSLQTDVATEVRTARSGWVFDLTASNLKDTLSVALSDEFERSERGVNAKLLVSSHYTWQAVADRLIDVYRTIKV